jgi:cobalt-precorrin-5B (C1)-methyltransferase
VSGTKKKRLRSGFTTGACAAAAAKAACQALLSGKIVDEVTIPFPDGGRHSFAVINCGIDDDHEARASVIKDAGDDPDVTNGAEISARVRLTPGPGPEALGIRMVAGEGVGMVTKPGLAVGVGEPAINPGPRRMIREALAEALADYPQQTPLIATVTIAVPRGRELATKTLNERLGIVGGLSILGTTGIVRPVSAEAWTATILASMAVARETGSREIVLSTGRTSEKAVQTLLGLPVEAYAMMGDYLHFSLTAAREFDFQRVHLAGMWAKVLKAAMEIPQTHVRHGALEVREAAAFIGRLAGSDALARGLSNANTAREIYDRLAAEGRQELITQVCTAARHYAESIAQRPVSVYLVATACEVVCHV